MSIERNEAKGVYEAAIQTGLVLAERSEAQGGWGEYFQGPLMIENEVIRAQTAIMLENCRNWLGTMNEATAAATLGGWVDYLYPIIRASFPNNPLHELVSVQPQTKRVGQIFWLNYIIGRSKGAAFRRGDSLYDATTGWSGQVGYTDETVIDEEQVADTAAATYAGKVAEFPMRQGQLVVTFANGGNTVAVRDNGNGGFVLAAAAGGISAISASRINYATGEYTVTFNAALAGGNAVTASYMFDGEMNERLPEISVELAASSITAVRRAVSLKYSEEAMQDFRAEFDMNIDQVIVTGCSQALIGDTCGEVIADIWDMCGAPVAQFDVSAYNPATSGYSRRHFFTDIAYPINQASQAIYDQTQKGEASWMIVDGPVATILETIGRPIFEPAPQNTRKQQGCVFIGMFNGLRVYRYIQMRNFVGAAAKGNIVIGYKGPDMWDAGYVWAPYQSLYMSNKDRRADLATRQALAMRYGKKRVNTAMYKRIELI